MVPSLIYFSADNPKERPRTSALERKYIDESFKGHTGKQAATKVTREKQVLPIGNVCTLYTVQASEKMK